MLVLLSLSALAADLYVGPGQPYATVVDAVAAAAANDTVHVAAGVYVGTVTVNTPVTIVGSGAGATILRGSTVEPVVVANNRLTLRDLQVDGQGARRGLDSNTTLALQLDDCDFRNARTTAVFSEGAAVRKEHGDLYVVDSVFSDNSSERGGGAIALSDGDLVLVRSRFLRNRATRGHGGAISDSGAGSLVVHQCEFTDNTTEVTGSVFGPNDGGGAIATWGRSSIEVRESTFHHNTSDEGGGAVAVYTTTDHVAFTHNRFCGNAAAGEGGAIAFAFNDGTHARVANNVFADNAGAKGGGVYWGDMGWFDVNDYYFPYGYGDPYPMTNNRLDLLDNTFVANDAGYGSHVMTMRADIRAMVTNNVFADGTSDPYDHGSAHLASGPDYVDYNLWWNNAPLDLGRATHGSHEVFADPGLAGFSDDGDCTNDDFTPGPAVVDVGVPTRNDRDGTRSDLGSELR